MKTIRALIQGGLSFLLALCLVAHPSACAYASYGQDGFAGKDWDTVIEEFFQACRLDPDSLSLGYYNTVTGEEHFHRPDSYMVAASMYKVPLNMFFAEQIAAGTLDWDSEFGGRPYRELMESSIIHSSNKSAEILRQAMGHGSYNTYRRGIAPYMGADPDTVESIYYQNNYFTARQMLNCLKLLYGEQERFPGVIDAMKQAEPERFFRLKENRFEIAHKYGYVKEDSHRIVNDCGIIYTEEPILLVIFTDNTEDVYNVIGDYCTLMCNYSQYHAARHHLEEQAALPMPSPSPVPEENRPSFWAWLLSLFTNRK